MRSRGTQTLFSENLPEIPSEFIEPYLVRFMTMEIEGVALGFTKPEQVRQNLKAIERFVHRFCGIHAQYATMNEFHKLSKLSDEKMIEICNQVFEEQTKEMQP